MLEVKKLSKSFGATRALSDLSFSLERGVCVVSGPNGAGKTTLLRTICGIEFPTHGEIEIDGIDSLRDPFRARRVVSYLSDSAPLYNDLTVEGHLIYRGRLKGLSGKRLRARIRHVTEIFDLKPIFTKKNRLLSQGEKKRVALADAVLVDCRLLALDDPFAGLDDSHIAPILAAIRVIGRHCVVLLATHALSDVSPIADSCLLLSSGNLVEKIIPSGDEKLDFNLSEAVAGALSKYYASWPEEKR